MTDGEIGHWDESLGVHAPKDDVNTQQAAAAVPSNGSASTAAAAQTSSNQNAAASDLAQKIDKITIENGVPGQGSGDAAPPQQIQQQPNQSSESQPPVEGTPAEGGDEDADKVSGADLSLMKKILRSGLIQSKSDVEVLRSDPNSPLYSAKSFEELRIDPDILRGLYDMGFNKPSKIQETALPIVMAKQDGSPPNNLIAQSQSGTGKTAAFLLASLSHVDTSQNFPQVLILAPTFELALQIGEVGRQMARHKPSITFKYAVKGDIIERGEMVREHVLIGTPGKVLDWAAKFRCFDIKKIGVFVLDEADVMIDTQGHRTQSIKIKRLLDGRCQLMLFSATYSDEVMEFADLVVPNAYILRLKRQEESLDNIAQYFVECPTEESKYTALANLFGSITMGQAFIFCHTKKSATWLAGKLKKDGHAVGLIIGDLAVEERTNVLQRFREGAERVLITTNLMARGIDVEQVTVVINYDLPVDINTHEVDKETYLHRIGRTGRFGKLGLAINFVDSQRTRRMIDVLEAHFGKKIFKLDTDDIDALEKLAAD